jgi:5,10-methylenetetrahydromethanopterin reductase
VRVGLRLPPCAPLPELAAISARAEQLGFDAVWFPDSQLLWRDVWLVAAAAAQATTRIGIGIAVTNVETRHPSVTASAMRTVEEVAPGRLRTGFGTGNSSLGLLGVAATPRAALGPRLAQIRALVDGADTELGGGVGRLRDPCAGSPIYIAATGPRNLRFAGEHADGVILLSGVSLPLLERSRAIVHEGMVSAGRVVEDVPVIVSAFAHVTDDVERDARVLKPLCAALAMGGATSALAAEGIELHTPRALRHEVYPDLVHAEDWEAAIAAVEPFVTDEAVVRFADRFCLFGTLDQIDERLRAVESAGVGEVLIQHVGSYDLPGQLAEQLAPLLARRSLAASR